uniref:Uncharacterized protein n=1 Tax=Molossus molossus TaxID=27622 RepID=A0A7J8J7W7_MOLMO|nr:hypothetical protein HJG59_009648 [Molossus molossus]
MPSEGRCMREETRALRGARVRLIRCDASYVAENPVVGSHLSGSSNLGSYSVVPATPQPSCQASLRGFRVEGRRSLVKMWAHNRLVLFLLTICVMLLLCYYLGFREYPFWVRREATRSGMNKRPSAATQEPAFPHRSSLQASLSESPSIATDPARLPTESPSVPDFTSPNTDLPHHPALPF